MTLECVEDNSFIRAKQQGQLINQSEIEESFRAYRLTGSISWVVSWEVVDVYFASEFTPSLDWLLTDEDSRVGGVVRSREGYERSRGSASTIGDLCRLISVG